MSVLTARAPSGVSDSFEWWRGKSARTRLSLHRTPMRDL